MKAPKYTTIFSSVIRPMVSEEKDEHLALASALDVSRFVPNIDTDKNIDLLLLDYALVRWRPDAIFNHLRANSRALVEIVVLPDMQDPIQRSYLSMKVANHRRILETLFHHRSRVFVVLRQRAWLEVVSSKLVDH